MYDHSGDSYNIGLISLSYFIAVVARLVPGDAFISFDKTTLPPPWLVLSIGGAVLLIVAFVLVRSFFRKQVILSTEKQTEQALQQQMKIASLRAAIGTSLNECVTLRAMLQRCAEGLHQQIGVTFARIWVLDETEQMFVLKASAGLYTHTDGRHSRIAFGQCRIGAIATQRKPHLSNDLDHDPLISDRDWVKREGMRAFAGYPLIVQSRLVGVMAVFDRAPLPQSIVDEMQSVAETIAVGIARKQADKALQESAQREKAIARVIQRMRQTLDVADIFAAATQELLHVIGCDRVIVYRFNSDWSGVIVAESVASAWTPILDGLEEEPRITDVPNTLMDDSVCLIQLSGNNTGLVEDSYLQDFEGGAFHQKRFYRAVNDIYQANFSECYLRFLEQIQANAYLITPIHQGKKLWGLLATYHNAAPHSWQPSEIKIVAQISEQLGIAVQQAELFTRTQQQSVELQKAKEVADAANKAKSDFLANMSHELRTPLNAILGFTQLITFDSSIKDNQREHLDVISRSGEHLLKLINDVLEMSKIEAGRMELDSEIFNVHSLVGLLEDMLRHKADAKGLHLSIECAPDVPAMIVADEGKLRQILINLLNNAIKFTEKGSIWFRILVLSNPPNLPYSTPVSNAPTRSDQETDPLETYLQFEVEDTGCGIPEEHQSHIFHPFRQLGSNVETAEGTGLGLAISQQFAQLMGGTITVMSQINQGSLFKVILPVKTKEQQTILDLPSSYDLAALSLAPGQPDYRILLVEDDLINRELVGKILTSLGMNYRVVGDGQKALEIWETWKPHFIWMDIQIPTISGLEVIRTIKALPHGKETIIVALTASAFEEQKQEIMASGCNDLLCKPFKINDILTKMTIHLGLRYSYSDAESQWNQLQVKENTRTQRAAQIFGIPSIDAMSREWQKQLYQAAALGSDQLALELIEKIPEQHSDLANYLRALINDFQFDKLMELTAIKPN